MATDKFILFQWRCSAGACDLKFDEYAHSDRREITCPDCGCVARRILSAPRIPISVGVDTDMPTMADKWAKMHQQGRKIDEKRAADNGPDAWGANGADVRR